MPRRTPLTEEEKAPKPIKKKTGRPPLKSVVVHVKAKRSGFNEKRKNPGGQVKTYTDELLDKAIRKAHGIAYAAAEMIGMDYRHLLDRINSTPQLKKAQMEAREARIDLAEVKLTDLVEEKGPQQLGAVCFTLKTIGRHRGYIEETRATVNQTSVELGTSDLDEMTDGQLNDLLNAISKRLEGRQ